MSQGMYLHVLTYLSRVAAYIETRGEGRGGYSFRGHVRHLGVFWPFTEYFGVTLIYFLL